MPFLGNTPANTFVSIAKQTITGNGGTSYSLSYPVTNANEIDVFYNNIRQEPTVAYSASGTTIAFTEAIQSTDSVYVIFNGQAIGTIDAPAGAYLPTSGGTVNGQLVVNQNNSSGTAAIRLPQDESTIQGPYANTAIRMGSNLVLRATGQASVDTAGAARIVVDSSGRVTKPYQPMFYARKTGSQSIGNGTTLTFDTLITNVGSHYSTSTNRFTAPVSGMYNFSAKTWINRNGLAWAVMDVFINGSQLSGAGAYYDSAINNTGNANYLVNIQYPLNAGDYVEFKVGCGTGNVIVDNSGYFSGYLIG